MDVSEPLPPPVSPIVCDLSECGSDPWGHDPDQVPSPGGVQLPELNELHKGVGDQGGEQAWTWESDGPSCEAVGGPAAGATCNFPFTYEGVAYYGCSYKPMWVHNGSEAQTITILCPGVLGPQCQVTSRGGAQPRGT